MQHKGAQARACQGRARVKSRWDWRARKKWRANERGRGRRARESGGERRAQKRGERTTANWEARSSLTHNSIPSHSPPHLPQIFHRYSGADIAQVCGEASTERMRKVLGSVKDVKELLRMKREAGEGFMREEGNVVGVDDFVAALGSTKNTVKDERKFVEWDDKYGSR